ncbi:MAG: hypothetical protein WC924_01720 [Candidatus Gracilibacteria bacterium]
MGRRGAMSEGDRAFDARYGDEWRKDEAITGRDVLGFLGVLAIAAGGMALKKVKSLAQKGVSRVLEGTVSNDGPGEN